VSILPEFHEPVDKTSHTFSATLDPLTKGNALEPNYTIRRFFYTTYIFLMVLFLVIANNLCTYIYIVVT
jgi:hypothetical protein